jgi:hypothetical protein
MVVINIKFYKKQMLRIQNIFLLILVFSLSSCVKEQFDAGKFNASLNLNPGLAVPIAYSNLRMEKYLRDASVNNELRISQDGFLSLYYSKNVISGTMGDLLSFPQISMSKTLSNQTGFPINLLTEGTSLDLVDSIMVPISLSQATARIDRIQILGGSLSMNLTAPNLTGTVSFQFPALKLNGVPLVHTGYFPSPGFNIPLAGYTLIPDHDAGHNNILKCRMSIHLQNPSGPVNDGDPLFNIQTDLGALRYESIFGNFSPFSISIPPIQYTPEVFSQIVEGHFEFTDPKIKLFFSNSIGIPGGFSFSELGAIDRYNNQHSLSGDSIPTPDNPKIISYPSINQVGETVKDSLIIDRTDSNLPEILASNPKSINISASAIINPHADTGTSFVRYDSKYDVTAAFELPLWGKAEFIVMLDTLDFDYLSTSLPVPEELDSLIVRINITNSFPVTLIPQVYLLDENRVLLDSLFTGEKTIEGAADKNGDGIVEPNKQDPVDIGLPIDVLGSTRYLVTKGRIMTTDFQKAKDVRFFLSNYLQYNIGLIARLKIKTGK